jgi:hypothetical protein
MNGLDAKAKGGDVGVERWLDENARRLPRRASGP